MDGKSNMCVNKTTVVYLLFCHLHRKTNDKNHLIQEHSIECIISFFFYITIQNGYETPSTMYAT